MRYVFIIIASCIFLIGCKKGDASSGNSGTPPTDTIHIPPPPGDTTHIPPQTSHDSVWVIKNVIGPGYGLGDSFIFEYDTSANLIKYYMPYGWASTSPCYVFYKNKKVDFVISDYKDPNYGVQKASMILVYGANNKCSKVYYKPPVKGYTNTSSYFYDLNDGQLYGAYDSLTYTASNQLQEIYYRSNDGSGAPSKSDALIKLYYGTSVDSVFNKLEYYKFDAAGNSSLYDQLLITTNNFDNLLYKNLWYYCFVNQLTILSGLGPTALPIILDKPTTVLSQYLSLSPKTLASYRVINTWGNYNLSSSFLYYYSQDSLYFNGYKPNVATSTVAFNLKKVKK